MIMMYAELRDCRAIRDILGTILLIGNFLNAVSTELWTSVIICGWAAVCRIWLKSTAVVSVYVSRFWREGHTATSYYMESCSDGQLIKIFQ